ncbi:hypothetical protein TorRG33x02_279540 [Trema orientale]|uniref:Uncharacterized protein n=1 Tax=Trema orientale TaxID=63057 RepID=A0A2P5CMN9_TREOI|nr:hypothetical protein TorRG33x02_279540 [Trema orientale]
MVGFCSGEPRNTATNTYKSEKKILKKCLARQKEENAIKITQNSGDLAGKLEGGDGGADFALSGSIKAEREEVAPATLTGYHVTFG